MGTKQQKNQKLLMLETLKQRTLKLGIKRAKTGKRMMPQKVKARKRMIPQKVKARRRMMPQKVKAKKRMMKSHKTAVVLKRVTAQRKKRKCRKRKKKLSKLKRFLVSGKFENLLFSFLNPKPRRRKRYISRP